MVAAEEAHAAAMEYQGEHNASIRAAAQAFVDFLDGDLPAVGGAVALWARPGHDLLTR